MALATVEKEILKVMNTSTTGLRNKMASKYIHDITVNAIDMAPVFQNGIQAVMEKAGFQPEIIQQINDRYNKRSSWQQISRDMFNEIQGFCAQAEHSLMNLPQFFAIKPARQVYMLTGSNANTWTIRIYNNDAKNVGGVGLNKFNRNLRIAAYKRFSESIPSEVATMPSGKFSNIESKKGTDPITTMGKEAPFVHQSNAVGKVAMAMHLEALKENQDFMGEMQTLQASGITIDCLNQIAKAVSIDLLKETVMIPDGSGGFKEEKRIVVRGNFETGNTAGSLPEDWVRIKRDLVGLKRNKTTDPNSLLGKEMQAGLSRIDALKKEGKAAMEAETSTNSKTRKISRDTHKILDAAKKSKITKKATTKLKKDKTKKGKQQKRVNTKKPSGTGVSRKKVKLNLGKGKGKAKLSPAEKQAEKDQNFLLKLEAQINKRLPAEVRRNMGRPALINQTGRFSSSVKLDELRRTPAGISGTYSYLLSPYETFENTGVRRWPLGYNPKPLIAKSIRKLALQYTEEKFVSLRRD